MSALLDLITGGIGPYLIAGLAALFGVIMALLRGKAKREVRDVKAKIETMQTAKEVKDEVAAKTDADRRADLNLWVRPD